MLGRIIREVSVKELSRHILAGVVMPAAVFHGLLDRYFRSVFMPIYHPSDDAPVTLQT